MNKPVAQGRDITTEFQDICAEYGILEYLGSGAYGIVCAVKEKKTEKMYAVKKCKNIFHSKTLAKRTLREIRLLKSVHHPHIIELQKVFIVDSTHTFSDVYLLFELMDTDLAQVIKSPQRLRVEHVQHFSFQLLKAIKYLHDADIIHRDLKPRNILINSDCSLKLADFGLARVFHDGIDHTSLAITEYVTTRWYRAPEILGGWTHYGKAIDLWAVGCILGELFRRTPLFPGGDSLKQLELLLTYLGRPEESFTIKCKKSSKRLFLRTFDCTALKSLESLMFDATNEGKDLISKLLLFDPAKRLSATECLYHPFFHTYPLLLQEKAKIGPSNLTIPVSAFDHEKWKPSVDEFREELLKDVEEFQASLEEAASCTSSVLAIETESSSQGLPSDDASHLQKLEKLSNGSNSTHTMTSHATNLTSQSSVTMSTDFPQPSSQRLRSMSSSQSMESAVILPTTTTTTSTSTRHKRRNFSRDTMVEDYHHLGMMMGPVSYESGMTASVFGLESRSVPQNPSSLKLKANGIDQETDEMVRVSRSFSNVSCQVTEKDFEEVAKFLSAEMAEQERKTMKEGMNPFSPAKTSSLDFRLCSVYSCVDREKSEPHNSIRPVRGCSSSSSSSFATRSSKENYFPSPAPMKSSCIIS